MKISVGITILVTFENDNINTRESNVSSFIKNIRKIRIKVQSNETLIRIDVYFIES